jgi:hypothetical protein
LKPNRINELYVTWEREPSPDNLEKLFTLVRRRIVTRYKLIEPELCEDIAQKSLLHIWRALIGELTAPVKFAQFCAMTARGVRKDMLKHERMSATKDDILIPLVSDIEKQKRGY